jgi:hypothetical protein
MSRGSVVPDGAGRFAVVLFAVLLVTSGGLALTATFGDQPIQSDVGVQIGSQFEYPQINQTGESTVRTSGTGRKTVLRSTNGTRLTVVQESMNESTLTITVPIRNNGGERGTTRLRASSSNASFTIDTQTISATLADETGLRQLNQHTVTGPKQALVEVPPTNDGGLGAVNVTVSYNGIPADPLAVELTLAPVSGQIDVQPANGTDGSSDDGSDGSASDGSSGDGSASSGESSTTAFVFVDSTSEELRVVTNNGSNVVPLPETNAQVIGPAVVDIDGDSRTEIPYVNDTNQLKAVDLSGEAQTLVETDGDATPTNSKSLLGVGSYNGSPESIYYADKNSEELYRITASENSSPQRVKTIGVDAVGTVGDIDGDNASEIVYAGSSQSLKYLDDDGTTENFPNAGAGSNNGVGFGITAQPTDINANGRADVPFVDGSNQIKLATTEGTSTILRDGSASKSPVAGVDVDEDGADEVLFRDSSSGEARFVDNVTGSSTVRGINASLSVAAGAGVVDGQFVDFDGDGLTADQEAQLGTKPTVADSDGDGINDAVETTRTDGTGPGEAVDTDGDGTIDARDTDSDDDGRTDQQEGTADGDNDGVAAYRDTDEPSRTKLEASTVVYNEKDTDALNALDATGSPEQYAAVKTQSLGPQADLFGDARAEVPYIGNDGNLNVVNSSGVVKTVVTKQENGDVDLIQPTRLGVADVDDDGTPAILFGDNEGRLRRHEVATDETNTVFDGNTSVHSVGGMSDFDADGDDDDIVITDGDSKNVVYYDQSEETVRSADDFSTKNSIKIGSPADFNGDGTPRVPAVNASDGIVLVGADSTTGVTNDGQPAGALSSVDIDDDSELEIVFANGNNNNKIKIVEINGSVRSAGSKPPLNSDGNGVA